MRKIYMLVCVTILGAGVFIYGRAALQESENQPYPPVPFEVTYQVTRTDPDGKVHQTTQVSQVQANGEWRETIVSQGKTRVVSSLPEGASVHVEGEQSRIPLKGRFASEATLKKYRTPAFLKNHPLYIGMDKVAGLDVYVHREILQGTSIESVETAHSPRTGFTSLRDIFRNRDGSSEIYEAVKVEFKEVPSNDDLRTIPLRQRPVEKQ